MSTPVLAQKPIAVLEKTEWNTPKARYWEITFEDHTEGVLALPPDAVPPSTANVMHYQMATVKKNGVDTNRIIYPLSPQMVQPREVVAAVENPVAASVTEPAEVKVPEKAYRAPDRDRLIVRQVALKASCDYHASLAEKPREPGLAMRLMAEWMEEWIFRSVE
jgi:hypothetical protein